MAQVNIRNIGEEAYARLQEAAEAEGVSVAEIARRALVAGPDVGHVASEVDQVLIRGGVPKWTRDKALKVITGTASPANPSVPRISA
jgi:hypothetical protein